MTRLRLVPFRQLRKVVESSGYVWVRSVGSHNVFRNPEGKTVAVPDHGSMVIVRPLLRKILRDLNMSVETYDELLDKI